MTTEGVDCLATTSFQLNLNLGVQDSGHSSLQLLNEFTEHPRERIGSFKRNSSRNSSFRTTSSSLRNEMYLASSPPSLNNYQQQMMRSSHERYDLEPTGPADRTFKVVFTGDAAVGKSSFISRLADGIFIGNTNTTLGNNKHHAEREREEISFLLYCGSLG